MGKVIELKRDSGGVSRIAYPKTAAAAGISPEMWTVLSDSIYPGAQTAEGILLAYAYCKARNLDVMKKPVHVVPMWSTKINGYVETVWPGVGELQTTAARTGLYAGLDEPVFGPDVTKTFTIENKTSVTVTFPEWAKTTVYRIVQGVRCAFTEPVYWEETFSRVGRQNYPTEIWVRRPKAQLAKCAKAAALRAAFPEELGFSAEEMDGRIIEAEEAVLDRNNLAGGAVKPGSASSPAMEAATDLNLGGIPADVLAFLKRVLERVKQNNAWEAGLQHINGKLNGSDLQAARLLFEQFKAEAMLDDKVGQALREVICRALSKANDQPDVWAKADAYLLEQRSKNKLKSNEFEVGIAALKIARELPAFYS
jgi:phage recombination protein Bet